MVCAGALWIHRQAIQDWLVVQQYQPAAEIAAIAERATMNEHGTFMFYASQPTIDDAEKFNEFCERREAAAAVLGCYRDKRIVIYRVTNKELDGIEETTAAHEMLHAAWDRMSQEEHQRLGEQLEQAYQRIKTPELSERMAYYDRQQPGERTNELHSILGTEQASIGDELEQHYARFFYDRHVIVKTHARYHALFRELEQQTAALKRDVETIESSLRQRIERYNTQATRLNAAVETHNQLLSSLNQADETEVRTYNQRRQELQESQVALNQERRQIDTIRQSYEDKLRVYNDTVLRANKLTDSIDSLNPSNGLAQ